MAEKLVTSVIVACALDKAFESFTRRINEWWPPGHRRSPDSTMVLEPRKGGRFAEIQRSGDELVLGSVIECQPPQRIVYTWIPGSNGIPTEVVVEFDLDGGHTRVTVVHSEGKSGLGVEWPERVKIFARNWDQVLGGFVSVLRLS